MKTSKQLVARSRLLDAIIPALDALGMGGRAAQELVLGTGIQESRLIYRKQNGGPALGLWQMEPFTFNDIWNGYILKHRDIFLAMQKILNGASPNPLVLTHNDQFAAAMCRMLYRRIHEDIPDAGDLEAQAAYWKKYYNTPLGRGKEHEYIANWHAYVDQDTFTGIKS